MSSATKEQSRRRAVNHKSGEALVKTTKATARRATAKDGQTNGGGSPRPLRDNHLVKVSLNLPQEEFEALKNLADRRQTSATQVVREALRTELYVQELVDSGAVIIAKLGRRAREIVFSQMRSIGQA
jgi:hypothetical protein